MFLVALPP
ncbi:alpha/beta-Hydrolases superfamily protein [Zea mays]|uniref:Alpha/beta-Hydrolases superfamily protein n=1 Tax=Zea mays TaxID=4577 RepID=A0A1D6M0F1_MAIZE|nr:alpha/beta-Hydrolases superfamily protein [Zea mays]